MGIQAAGKRRKTYVEALERRAMLAAQINYADFSSTAGLAFNGFGASATTLGTSLKMTDSDFAEARSVWATTAVPIETFKTTFSFRSNTSATSADGITFTVQGGDTTQLGIGGLNLGYTGIPASQAVAFNFFNTGNYGSQFGFAANGQVPPTNTDITPIDLHSGHLMHATVLYDGHNLTADVTDATDRSLRFTDSKVVHLASIVGANTATVGFTASTGTHISTQTITSWTYAGVNAPTISTAASADPSPVTAKITTLSALGADAGGENNLTYRWTETASPTGARAVTFSGNDTNAAKSITATFFKAGTYRFRVTATNAGGGSAFSNVTVPVEQTPTSIRVAPHKQVIAPGGTRDYSAAVLDQFNHPLRTQPAPAFSVQEGPGAINAATGRFTTASTDIGHVVIAATADDLTGTVGATVVG